jgi:hypothetical protein
VSLETYLKELVDPTRPLGVARLVNLSHLAPDEVSAFEDAWRDTDAQRRLW